MGVDKVMLPDGMDGMESGEVCAEEGTDTLDLEFFRVEFPSAVAFLVLLLLFAGPIMMVCRHLHHCSGGEHIKEEEEGQEQDEFDMHGAVDVLIIGGGLSGLALAASLSKLNVHCLVVEKNDFRDTGAVLGVQPNGLKALKEISPAIATAIEQRSILIPETGGIMSEWIAVRNILLEHVRCQTDTEIISHARPITLKIHPEGVRVTLRHNRFPPERILAHCVVAADGVHSSVRKLLGLAPAVDAGVHVARAVVDCTVCCPILSVFQKVAETSILVPIALKIGASFFSAFNFNTIHKGKIRWTWISKDPLPKDPGECKTFIVDKFLTGLNTGEGISRTTMEGGSMGDMPTPVSYDENASGTSIASCLVSLTFPRDITVSHISTTVLGDDDTTAWGGRGRVTLIGDAAHAMRAASGQGSSMAFEDVCVLTRAVRGWDVFATQRSRPLSVAFPRSEIPTPPPVMTPIIELKSVSDEKDEGEREDDDGEWSALHGVPITPKQRVYDSTLLPKALRAFEESRIARVRLVHNNERRVASAAYSKLNNKFGSSKSLLGMLESVNETDVGPLVTEITTPTDNSGHTDDPYSGSPRPDLCRDDSPIAYEGNRSTKRMDMQFREWLFEGV